MSAPATKPRRRLRSEFLSLAPILLLAAALVALFPRKALSFRAAEPPPRPARPLFAFIPASAGDGGSMSDIVNRAFSSRPHGTDARAADILALDALPEELPRPIVVETDLPVPGAFSAIPYDPCPMPPTRAAPPPERIEPPAERPRPKSAFPREELLEIIEDTQERKEAKE